MIGLLLAARSWPASSLPRSACGAYSARIREPPLSALASACRVLWPALASLTAFLATVSPPSALSKKLPSPILRLKGCAYRLQRPPRLPRLPGSGRPFPGYHGSISSFAARPPDSARAWTTPRHGSMAERLGKALHMNYVYARANGSRRLIGFEEGSAILSRFPSWRPNALSCRPGSRSGKIASLWWLGSRWRVRN